MHKIKVMLASRPKILSEVIRNIIEKQIDMDLVGEVVDPIHLLFATREIIADVIIVSPLETNGKPKICEHLLAEHPQLKIIVIVAKGKLAHVYQAGSTDKSINDPSADTIIKVIRETGRFEKEKT